MLLVSGIAPSVPSFSESSHSSSSGGIVVGLPLAVTYANQADGGHAETQILADSMKAVSTGLWGICSGRSLHSSLCTTRTTHMGVCGVALRYEHAS